MTPANSDRFEKSKAIRHLQATLSSYMRFYLLQQVKVRLTAQSLSLSIVLLATCGCHPFGARATLSDQDDWEAPTRNAYSMPRQFQSQYSNRNKTSDAPLANAKRENSGSSAEKPNVTSTEVQSTTTKPADSKAANATEQPKPNTTANKPATNATTDKLVSQNSSSTPEPTVKAVEAIAETNESDLDLQTAIAALPPNLQEVFRNQLLATAGSALSQKPTEQLVSTSGTSSTLIANEATPPTIASSDSTEQTRNSVKLSLSDRTESRPAAEQPEAKNSSITAVANSETRPTAVSRDDTLNAPAPLNSTSPVALAYGHELSPVNSIGREPNATAVQTASATATVERSLTWDQSLLQAETALQKELENGSTMDDKLRFKYELALRLIHLANNNLEQALEPIEGMQQSEQEYFRYQLQALFDSTNPEASPVASRRWALVMENQRKANQHLASISNLEIRNAAFCTDVQGYGSVTAFQSKLFKPDQDVLLYCELENVTADEIRNGFETQLQGSYEIVDSRGNRIADQLLPMEKEICSNYRRDYFVVYRIFMPLQIAPGNYEMRVTIEDMKGKKFGQTSLEFQIQK